MRDAHRPRSGVDERDSAASSPVLLLWLWVGLAGAAMAATPPAVFEARGVGGGGALFAPSWSPHAVDALRVACDMGELFASVDAGVSWQQVDFRELRGNRLSAVQFTGNPLIEYCLDSDFDSGGYHPSRSTDGGLTWTRLAIDPTGGDAWGLLVDPADGDPVLVSSYDTVYRSTDAGATFAAVHSDSSGGAGLLMAGALFDGANVYLGTNRGLLVSGDGGASFALQPTPGIPGGQTICSMAGGREGGTTRLLAVTVVGTSYPGIAGDSFTDFAGVYTLDVGQPSWVARSLPGGGTPFFAGMATGEVDVMYVAGGGGGVSVNDPVVFRSTNGGASWQVALQTDGNANVVTGWCGAGGDRSWGYAELCFGFAVSPLDANRVAFTDFGFAHASLDGGTTWRQLYVDPAGEHPAGSPTPQGQSYQSNGLENTTSYAMHFASATDVFAGFCDIRGIRSTDGGASFSFAYTGHSQNSMYEIVQHPGTGALYAATSTIHDIYQSTRLRDSILDPGGGRVLASTDAGATWTIVHDFGRPVIWVALDPNAPDRLYASVIHSSTGGIYVTNDLSLGAASTWVKLANPPRTLGHPFNVRVLADGTLVCTYSGHRTATGTPVNFTDSSGVFVSIDGGATWIDRSDPGMVYWTKDVVIDPHDPGQNTWYVGVFSGWGPVGAGLPAPQTVGGLYRTTNRGVSWTRISALGRVTSCAVSPTDPEMAFLTTEADGLWWTSDLSSPAPTWMAVTSYHFRQPERVYWNPFDPGELWVTSFGNALAVGQMGGSSAGGCGDCNGDLMVSILDALVAAQHAVALLALADPAHGQCNVSGIPGGTAVPGAVVDILDALLIARFSAGSISTLSCM